MIKISLSDLDQDRFNYKVAKAHLNRLDDVEELIFKAMELRAELVIVRVSTEAIDIVQQLEAKNALLMDTLVYFQKKKVDGYDVELPKGYSSRMAMNTDAEPIGNLAKECFRGYFGHYHADKRLNDDDCDAVYSSWAENSCRKGALADGVIVIEKADEFAAFATLKTLDKNSFEGVLFGVARNHQGVGLHLNLMQLSQNWGVSRDLHRMVTSTQINNVMVQKNWCRVGLEPMNSFYTLHLWLNYDPI